MKTFVTTLVFVSATVFAVAQKNSQKNEIRIPIKAESWTSQENKAKFVDHKGVPSIDVQNDIVIAKNVDFANGTIEFDVEATQGFVGIYFRWQNEDESEFFYLRGVADPARSIDAVQYAPIIKQVNMWDMYPNYQTAANFKRDEWAHIKLVVSGSQMLVFVNDKTKPTLQVQRLEGNTKNGSIAVQGSCFVSNVVVKPNEVEGLSPAEGFDPAYNDVRYIRNWQVSQAMPLPAGQELNNSNMPDIQTTWQPIVAERGGLVNVTRLYGQSSSRRYVWLRSKLVSKTARKIKLNFGFSDEVWVFVNERTCFVDKNLYGQGMRKKPDGRISIENSTFEMQLKEGDNEIVVGLANDFYGWGIIAHLEDLEGITMSTEFAIETIKKDFEKYFGTYGSKNVPVKVKVSQKNNKLSLLPTAESPILCEKTGDNTFKAVDNPGITIEFFPAENKFVFKNGGGQEFVFNKE